MRYTDRSHVDFDLPSLNSELASRIVDEAYSVMNEGRNASSRFISRGRNSCKSVTCKD